MATYLNTVLFPIEYTTKFQQRLDYPTNWKAVCKVVISNTYTLTSPYMSTIPSLTTNTRGTAYTHQTFVLTTDTATITDAFIVPMVIDRADLAQQTYVKLMDMAELQGQLVNEKLESTMLASHADWTNFSNGTVTTGTNDDATITVASTNIDDIITAMIREIQKANGWDLAQRNGMFIIWRPADFELLMKFMMANGFNTADAVLKDGTLPGVRYMGVDHYVSNSHAAVAASTQHLFGGVKGLYYLGILRDTYGQVVYDNEPATADGALSGIAVVTRVDFKFKAWYNQKAVLYDILVAG